MNVIPIVLDHAVYRDIFSSLFIAQPLWKEEIHYLDIVSNQASFADTLSDEEPHQHLSSHKSIPHSILKQNKGKHLQVRKVLLVKFKLTPPQIK